MNHLKTFFVSFKDIQVYNFTMSFLGFCDITAISTQTKHN